MAEEVPEHIKKYKKLQKHAEQIVDTTARHHRQAYDKAVEDVLIAEGKEHADYDLLKETKHQVAFADKMSDFYIKKAKSYFKVHGDLDDLEKELLMKAYAGTTKSQLRQYVAEKKEKFSFDTFKKLYDRFIGEIKNTLADSAAGHFTDDHIDDILKYSLQDDTREKIKPYMSLEKAKLLLANFIEAENQTKYGIDKYDLKKFIKLNKDVQQVSEGREEILPSALTGAFEKELEKKHKKRGAA